MECHVCRWPWRYRGQVVLGQWNYSTGVSSIIKMSRVRPFGGLLNGLLLDLSNAWAFDHLSYHWMIFQLLKVIPFGMDTYFSII